MKPLRIGQAFALLIMVWFAFWVLWDEFQLWRFLEATRVQNYLGALLCSIAIGILQSGFTRGNDRGEVAKHIPNPTVDKVMEMVDKLAQRVEALSEKVNDLLAFEELKPKGRKK